MSARTRIKLCGLTRMDDIKVAVDAGADALGFVFYERSQRYIKPESVSRLLSAVPSFVCTVGLFVNATPEQVHATVSQAPVSLLQFHGDETIEQCCESAKAANRPFIKALHIKPDTIASDLLKYEQECRTASGLFAGLLLDNWTDEYGGSGRVFDWSLIPQEIASRVILSGGLNAHNATDAVIRMRPYAVDVSSGIEQGKGIKDPAKIRAFISAIRLADATAG
jgi:phosphoribosylanthranilate isomerase